MNLVSDLYGRPSVGAPRSLALIIEEGRPPRDARTVSFSASIALRRQAGEQGGGFVVCGVVSVIRRAVAGGQAVGFLGVMASSVTVAAGQREAGKVEVGVGTLEDVAAAFGDEQRFLGQPLGFVRGAGGGSE